MAKKSKIVENADINLKYLFGFISPTGEFIACDLCEHAEKALELLEALGVDLDDDRWYVGDGYTDILVQCGWIVIHGISCLEIEIPENRPITESQKLRMAIWFNAHSDKYENIYADCSKKTIENLHKIFEMEEN